MTVSKKKQFKQYNTAISKLFKIILGLNKEQQEMLLKYAESLPKKEKRAKDRKTCHTKIFFATSEKVHHSYIQNISSTGLFIKADEPMLTGEKLIMLFNLKGINKTLRIKGEVVHTTHEGIGVRFKNYIPPLNNKLNNVIAHKQN